MNIQKIGRFLHILDTDDTLNLADIAFMVILVKIIVAVNVDWPSMVTLMTVSLNMMHQRHVNAGDTGALQAAIQENSESVKSVLDKAAPVIDAVKGALK